MNYKYVSITGSAELRELLHDMTDEADSAAEKMAIRLVDKHDFDKMNACIMVLGAFGHVQVGILKNLAKVLELEWDPKPFAKELEALLQKHSLTIVERASGEVN